MRIDKIIKYVQNNISMYIIRIILNKLNWYFIKKSGFFYYARDFNVTKKLYNESKDCFRLEHLAVLKMKSN